MKRFASTRSDVSAWQASPGSAQWSSGSIDDDGIRYGFTTQALSARTIRIAPASVTIQSMPTRRGRGRRCVRRSTGLRTGLPLLRVGEARGDDETARLEVDRAHAGLHERQQDSGVEHE